MTKIRDILAKMNSEESDGDFDISKIAGMIDGVSEMDPSQTETDVAEALLLEKIAEELTTGVEIRSPEKGDSTENPDKPLRDEAEKIVKDQDLQPDGKDQKISPKTAPPTNEDMTNKGDKVSEKDESDEQVKTSSGEDFDEETVKMASAAWRIGEEIAEEYFNTMTKIAEELLPKIAEAKITSADPTSDLAGQTPDMSPETAPGDNMDIVGEGSDNPQKDTGINSEDEEQSKALQIEKLRQKVLDKEVTGNL